MKKLKLSKNGILIDDIPFFIYSGEIHYFRIPKKLWNLHLKKAKQAGLNTISSYIPWCFHEKEEGKFNFEDIIKFLEVTSKMGFYFIARIGPVSNAELVYEGLPGWLCKNYPEVFIQGKDLGSLPHATLVSYHNPTFLKFVERWYKNVLQVIKEYQVTSSGNIILLQLCNEIGMVHWLHKSVERSEITEKMYVEFLKNEYGSIDELNTTYKINYKSFSEIKQPQDNIAKENSFQIYYDWMNFYSDYYAKYYEFLYKLVKNADVTIPVVANIPQFYDFDVRGRGVYSPMTTIMFRKFTNYVPEVIFGGAYQMRRLDYDNFHDVLITTDVVRMISKDEVPSICCELQTGKLSDRPKIYPQDVELNLKLSTASGLAGLNAYMFSGGVNSKDTGAFGTYHEWQAPVSSDGKPREHFTPLVKFGMLTETFGELFVQTEKHNDLTVGFYAPYYSTELLNGDFVNNLDELRTKFFFDGFARLLYLAGYSYDIVDLERISVDKLIKRETLFLFSLDFMSGEVQKKLYEYLVNGGTLVLTPKLPLKNLMNDKESFLADKIGVKIIKEIHNKFAYFNDKEVFIVTGTTQIYENVTKKEILATTKNGEPCAFIKTVGKGKIIVLGFGISHIFDYHINLIDDIAKLAGVKRRISVEPFGEIVTVLKENDKFGFLFVFNYHEVDKPVVVKLTLPGEKNLTRIPAKGKFLLMHRSGCVLPLNVPIDENVKIKYTTFEILKYQKTVKDISFVINNNVGNGEVCFTLPKKPKKVQCNTCKVSWQYNNSILKILIPQITENGKETQLKIVF